MHGSSLAFLLVTYASFLISPSLSQRTYNVTAQRLSPNPIISKTTGSAWDFNYNPTIFTYNNQTYLIVRSQNRKNESASCYAGPSILTLSYLSFNSSGFPSATPVVANNVTFDRNATVELCGTEDPRISYYNGRYYLFYTSYAGTPPQLSSAFATDPTDLKNWTKNYFVMSEQPESKSGASLFATAENGLQRHYLFWGDSSHPPDGIGIAVANISTGNEPIVWNNVNGSYLLKTRNASFDSKLVESGPPPFRLRSSDYLFIYNSARVGYPSVKPDWDLQYNVGFAILNGSDPTQVLQRSDQPILSPETEWEIGNTNTSDFYLTPNVVFLEGMIEDPNGCPSNTTGVVGNYTTVQCFFGVYGSADSEIGAVRIFVAWNDDDGNMTTGDFNATTGDFNATTTVNASTTTVSPTTQGVNVSRPSFLTILTTTYVILILFLSK